MKVLAVPLQEDRCLSQQNRLPVVPASMQMFLTVQRGITIAGIVCMKILIPAQAAILFLMGNAAVIGQGKLLDVKNLQEENSKMLKSNTNASTPLQPSSKTKTTPISKHAEEWADGSTDQAQTSSQTSSNT